MPVRHPSWGLRAGNGVVVLLTGCMMEAPMSTSALTYCSDGGAAGWLAAWFSTAHTQTVGGQVSHVTTAALGL